MSSDPRVVRWTAAAIGVALGVLVPAFLSDFLRALAADAAIAGLIVLSLVVLTGLVGQISFCQYSFAAIGAFTVGCLVAGHHWDFWLALVVGVLFSAAVGVLVGIPALRLSGLFLAILTIGVALFFDRFLLAPGTWDTFSGGLSSWRPGRPSFFGIGLHGEYAFYLFAFGALLAACLLVWNLRTGKTGRVLRAVRESEVAASTVGLNLTAWKLTAFGISAALAGLAGGLAAVRVGSVSAGSYDILHSLTIAAIATVVGVGSIASAAAGGIFLVFGPEALNDWTPLSTQWFNLIVGAALIFQLVFTPDGIVVDLEKRVMRRLRPPTSEPPVSGQRQPDKVPVRAG
ncbi:MAG: branched-chain amino acid ABC transporter permease [Acidimicrobiia bacterium]|nr:branched-chain amino acid ABC transporter permease [Acidimicrobiia bacterium]